MQAALLAATQEGSGGQMPDGRVTRILAGFYDVTDPDGGMRRCRARGVFRKRGVTVLVGDRVTYEAIGSQEGVVTAVAERTTQLVRPPVANVDMALLVFSVASPAFHHYLLDAALVSVQASGLRPVIVVTKCDLASTEMVHEAIDPYTAAGFRCLPVSVALGQGVEEVRAAVRGLVSVFVGPSGAGKSSLGNELSPELGLKMGQVSEKLGRGKHTTRHVELFEIEPHTFVVDAPGFSQLDVQVGAAELWRFFPEFLAPSRNCPYRGCRHVDESSCGVKTAVEDGVVARRRYENYVTMYAELRRREESRY